MERDRQARSIFELGPEPHDALRADFRSFYASLDLLLATLVLGLVLGYAAHIFPIVLTKVGLVEPIILSESDRVFAHEHFAMTGSWPPADAPETKASDDSSRISKFTRAVALRDGGRLDYALEPRGMPQSVLSFRPFVAAAAHPVSVVWLCASAQAPPQFETSAVNGTTIEPMFLPWACRRSGQR